VAERAGRHQERKRFGDGSASRNRSESVLSLEGTAYHHPEGNSYIERFHRSLKEEEVWPAEYRSVQEARESIGRWIGEYNYDRPHHGVRNRTPHEAFLSFETVLKNEALTV
jgi:transposase InsO family protein